MSTVIIPINAQEQMGKEHREEKATGSGVLTSRWIADGKEGINTKRSQC